MRGLVDGAVLIVTGGSSGLGRAVALRFAEEGAKAIVVADVSPDPREGGERTVNLLEARGVKAVFVETDVTDATSVRRAVAAADSFGGVTSVVTSAGVLGNTPLFDIDEAMFDRILAVNAKGTFLMAQEAARSIVAGKRAGTIVLVSSIGGVKGSGLNVPYSTSKGAVNLMGFALANALAEHDIRVNVVQPGVMDTAMTKGAGLKELGWKVALGRSGTTTEIANAVVYFSSPLSSYVTAASLLVDGGLANVL